MDPAWHAPRPAPRTLPRPGGHTVGGAVPEGSRGVRSEGAVRVEGPRGDLAVELVDDGNPEAGEVPPPDGLKGGGRGRQGLPMGGAAGAMG